MKNNLLILLMFFSACAPQIHEHIVYGFPGVDGANGVISLADAGSECPNGGTIIVTATDTDRNGVVSSLDTNVMAATICNGTDGANGVNGQDGTPGQAAVLGPATPVEIIDPCGSTPGIFNEVLLRLNSGKILCSFSDNAAGANTRFSIIGAGAYQTTDGSHCHFSIDANNNVTW